MSWWTIATIEQSYNFFGWQDRLCIFSGKIFVRWTDNFVLFLENWWFLQKSIWDMSTLLILTVFIKIQLIVTFGTSIGLFLKMLILLLNFSNKIFIWWLRLSRRLIKISCTKQYGHLRRIKIMFLRGKLVKSSI